MNVNLKRSDRLIGKWTQHIILFGSSLVLPLVLIRVSHAASSGNGSIAASQGLSWPALLSIIIGAILTVFYVRGMYQVLHYASETYSIDFDDPTKIPLTNQKASKLLLFGSAMLVVLSALIISSYGWGSAFLYVGPILCLLGPIVVIVSMALDVRKYKQVLRQAVRETALENDRFLAPSQHE